MMYLGVYDVNDRVVFRFSTHKRDGSTVSPSISTAEIMVFKDDQPSPMPGFGYSLSQVFSSHWLFSLEISVANASSPGFFSPGHEYQVAIIAAPIDGQNVNACLAMFSIGDSKAFGGARVS